MLSKIKIVNFKSIEDLTIDFSFAEGKAPNGYEEQDKLAFIAPTKNTKDRLIPVLAIYGANASGKSNIIQAFTTLLTLVSDGVKPFLYNPNKLSSPVNEETFFEIEFFINSKKYTYGLGYNQYTITQEYFKTSKETLFEISEGKLKTHKNLETSISKAKDFKEIYAERCLKELENSEFYQVRTFFEAIVDKAPGLNRSLTQSFNNFFGHFTVGLENKLNPMLSVEFLSKCFDNCNYDDLFAKMLNILQNLNIDITKMEHRQKTMPKDTPPPEDFLEGICHRKKGKDNDTFAQIISYHKNKNNEDIPFNFDQEESDGTKIAFGLLGPILVALKNGGMLVLDEIDRSLHPLILVPLIKMFKDKTTNPLGAQLIFTSHTTEILEDEDFRISEFLFVNKTQKAGTVAKRLSDIENARNDVNFRLRYINGLYRGIPYPTL